MCVVACLWVYVYACVCVCACTRPGCACKCQRQLEGIYFSLLPPRVCWELNSGLVQMPQAVEPSHWFNTERIWSTVCRFCTNVFNHIKIESRSTHNGKDQEPTDHKFWKEFRRKGDFIQFAGIASWCDPYGNQCGKVSKISLPFHPMIHLFVAHEQRTEHPMPQILAQPIKIRAALIKILWKGKQSKCPFIFELDSTCVVHTHCGILPSYKEMKSRTLQVTGWNKKRSYYVKQPRHRNTNVTCSLSLESPSSKILDVNINPTEAGKGKLCQERGIEAQWRG